MADATKKVCPRCEAAYVQALAWWTTTDGGDWKYQPTCTMCGDTGEVDNEDDDDAA